MSFDLEKGRFDFFTAGFFSLFKAGDLETECTRFELANIQFVNQRIFFYHVDKSLFDDIKIQGKKRQQGSNCL
jgi:hypothetical protein